MNRECRARFIDHKGSEQSPEAGCTIRGMRTRILLSFALGLSLGGRLPAQEPGAPDYVADPQAVDEFQRLGEEEGSDYELDGDPFDEATDQAGLNVPQVVPPTRGNPEPPGEGAAPNWEPDDDYDEIRNVIETAEEEREWWRARVEQKLRQLSQSY